MEMNPVPRDELKIDDLVDEILVEIFSNVDGEELLSFQTVCSSWHRVIDTLLDWKRILERKMRSSATWKEVWNYYATSTSRMPSSYKTQFEEMNQKIQEMDRNWRSGKYTEVELDSTTKRDDQGLHYVVHDARTHRITHTLSPIANFGRQFQSNPLFLRSSDQDHCIVDVSNGNEIKKKRGSLKISQVAVNSEMMAIVYCERMYGVPYSTLQVWHKEAEGFELLSEEAFDDVEIRVEMDESYMALYEPAPVYLSGSLDFEQPVIVYFRKNSHVERSIEFQPEGTAFLYSQGYFFLIQERGEIRIMEVSTGEWVGTIQHPKWKWFPDALHRMDRCPVAVNSKYLATVDTAFRIFGVPAESIVRIYDLVAAKNPSSEPCNLLLATIHIPAFGISDFKVYERDIYVAGMKPLARQIYHKSFDFWETADSANSK